MPLHFLKNLLAFALFLVFLYGTIFNGVIVFGGLFLKKKMPSIVPFVGGVTGLYALKLAPWESVHAYWWVPLLLDFGCVPCVVLFVLDQLIRKIKGGNRHD